jgi:glycine/D-amino acid oxidase-like deaminating enzyme
LHADSVIYRQITASKIIFCNGVKSFETGYWKNLPYVYNKGEALIAEIPGLPASNIYKSGALTIVPWHNNLWWIGSSYENEFETSEPTEQFKNNFTASLKSVLKIPFTIVDHIAAIRPAAVERRPFVGLHPHQTSLWNIERNGNKKVVHSDLILQATD